MMQTPMEISSLIMTRAGSGTSVRLKAGQTPQDTIRFARAMEDALVKTQTKPSIKGKKSNTEVVGNNTMTAEPKKPGRDSGADEALAAGAMGNKNPVVFILEGDDESATELDICVDAAAPAGASATANRMGTDAGPLTVKNDDYGPAPDDADLMAAMSTAEEKASANTAKAEIAQGAAAREEYPGIANSKTAAGQDAASNEGALSGGNTIGSVTARMPVARTSERHEKEENDTDFSEKGNLSHLENENDKVHLAGQKGKTYSDTADEVKDAAKGMPETANNAPAPLTEGIIPEQFRAEQQMRQAAPNAPVKTENLLDEMVSRIETMKTESQSTMSIQLKPEFLGKVALEIAMDAAGLHVKINAADSGVRAMLNGQINTLIESLGNKGIEIVEVEVAYTGIDNSAFREPREEQGQPGHSRRPYRETEAADVAEYYSVLPFEMLDYYIDAGVSSVEYRA